MRKEVNAMRLIGVIADRMLSVVAPKTEAAAQTSAIRPFAINCSCIYEPPMPPRLYQKFCIPQGGNNYVCGPCHYTGTC
jgi:hypothetical protein